MNKKSCIRLGLLVVVAVLALNACAQSPEIPFETIFSDDNSNEVDYELTEPALAVLTTKSDIAKLDGRISPKARDVLENLDYRGSAFIIAFQGWKGSGGHRVTIKQVYRYDNGPIVVNADFITPNGFATSNETAPLHIIRIPIISVNPNGQEFQLRNNHRRIASVTYIQ